MERYIESGKIILLFDSYHSTSKLLHESFLRGGYDVLAVSMEENDFLPANVLSIYDLILGYYKDGESKTLLKPKYFNEIAMPDIWSVSAEDERWGKVTYQREVKGRIHYLKSAKNPLVSSVDWYDRIGGVRFRDHYNRWGYICARTIYDAAGEPMSKSWLSPEGCEVIMENCVTGDIILNDGDTFKSFRKRIDLFLYCLKELGFEQGRIFFNSLSTPFLMSNRLSNTSRGDVLFWQEIAENEVPANMRMILDKKVGRTEKIVVQTRESYQRLLELGVDENKIQRLGFIYPFERENEHRPQALICTESDRIEHLEELIREFPKLHFHIAAQTLMSQKLRNLDQYENVSLYEGVNSSTLDDLFQKCDYYFDINYRTEIVFAVYRAFLNKQLIFAFQETVHNKEYIASDHIYHITEFERMVSDIQGVMKNKSVMNAHLKKQWTEAMAETRQSYARMLNL